jgi:branched-chain amino acid transport system substrate-binding protein
MSLRRIAVCALVALGLLGGARAALAQEPLKIGLLAPFSGPFAEYGAQADAAIKTFLKQNGETVAGRKVQIIKKDTTGPAPEVGKRLAQELVVRDNVDVLMVHGFTPETLTVAAVATEVKKPVIVTNASSAGLTSKSPYLARVSFTFPQVTVPMAMWAAKNGVKKVVTLVSDYTPGIDAETAFKGAFTAAGGQVIESVRVPLKSPDFAPFVQRVKDSKPDGLFVFVPAGEQGVALMKSFFERGLPAAGIKLVALGDVVDDHVLSSFTDNLVGTVTSQHYSIVHDSPENKAFVKAFAEVNGTQMRPNFMAVAAYDGMTAIYEVAKRLGGKIDADKAMEVLKGMKIASPRGPITIDAQSRDIVQNVYIRRVEKVGGRLENVEFDTFADFKDPASK